MNKIQDQKTAYIIDCKKFKNTNIIDKLNNKK